MPMFDEPHKMLVTSFNGDIMGEYTINTHREEDCKGPHCALHNPSVHPLSNAPMVFRQDKHALIERQCIHGIGHPDPDSLDFIVNYQFGDESLGVHGCDGCCGPVESEEW